MTSTRMDKIMRAGEDCLEVAALAERRAVVEYLRLIAPRFALCSDGGVEMAYDAADAIENGQHLRSE